MRAPRRRRHELGASRAEAHDAQMLTSSCAPITQLRSEKGGRSQAVLEREALDSQAGMLSGISRERSVRSNLYWFTEFCNSQCLSHFAAPFIVVRAETSVAESCKSTRFSEEGRRAGARPGSQEREETTSRGSHKNVRTSRPPGLRLGGPAPSPAPLPNGEGRRERGPRAAPALQRKAERARGAAHREVHIGSVGRVRMILPQVHLRKPCYDFSFL